jgi:hypothetical protein
MKKIEKTVIIEGSIQGKFTDSFDTKSVKEWVAFAAETGLKFSFEDEGTGFSIYADPKPVEVESVKGLTSEVLKQMIESLVKIGAVGLSSTIRSTEIKHGFEVQSVYLVSPAGEVVVQQRDVDVDTEEVIKAAPLTLKHRIFSGLFALAFLAAAFGISSIFVDYKALFTNAGRSFKNLDFEAFEIDSTLYDDYFTISEKKEYDNGLLTLEITYIDFSSVDDESFLKIGNRSNYINETVICFNLLKKQVPCIYYDNEGNEIYRSVLLLKEINATEESEASVKLVGEINPRQKPYSVKLVY